MLTLRTERAEDIPSIHEVNALAFGRDNEARLVDRLRNSSAFIPELSLVAERGGQIIGHVLFSRIHIETPAGDVPALALAPVAVLPERQKQTVGAQLIRHGIERARQLHHQIIVLIGHPNYYPRFGFVPARPRGLEVSLPVPDPAFMVLELVAGALRAVRGTVRYPAAFDEV